MDYRKLDERAAAQDESEFAKRVPEQPEEPSGRALAGALFEEEAFLVVVSSAALSSALPEGRPVVTQEEWMVPVLEARSVEARYEAVEARYEAVEVSIASVAVLVALT